MRVCTKANISIDDERTGGFIDVQEISKRLKQADMFPLGKQMQHINARNIEEMLKRSAFVKTAECYKTEDGQVFISISQLTPVVRVKAENGDDYYLDDKDCIMPNSAYTSDLVIATGNISRTFAVKYLSPLAKAIMANDLWHNLVEQINVLPNADIEIVPRIGDHIVCLGPLPEATTKEKRQQLINDFVNTKFTRLENSIATDCRKQDGTNTIISTSNLTTKSSANDILINVNLCLRHPSWQSPTRQPSSKQLTLRLQTLNHLLKRK